MNVLSLFDGMSCGQIALQKLGIKVDRYFASEIDKYAIQIAKKNFPNTIHLGDVRDVMWPETFEGCKIDLLMGGSPCQGFSFAGKRLNFEDPRSKLFFEFVRLLKECKPKYFLLENVKMKQQSQDIISEMLGVKPILINSSLVSAQNRQRLYWTNIPFLFMPADRGILMRDILEDAPQDFTTMSKNFIERNKDARCLVSEEKDKASNLSAMEYVKNGRQGDYIRCDSKTGRPDFKERNARTGLKLVGHAANIKGHDILKRVYHPDGKAPTLTTMGGGHREPKVLCGAFRGRYNSDGSTSQRLEIQESGRSNSLTTVQKDNVVVDVQEKTWRKLTPLECERLQTVPDKYTEGVSNTQRYKMLGNGWTVDVVAHILKNMEVNNVND